MPTLKELESAFIKADDAGNAEDAKAFADEIRRLKSQTPSPGVVAPSPAVATPSKPYSGARYDIAGVPQVRMESPTSSDTLREMATSAGGATAGQMIGTAVFPGVGTAIGGAIGGGATNLVNQLQRMAQDPDYKFQYGELIADIGTGAIPGAPLASSGLKAVGKEALKQGVGALAGAQTQAAIDRGELLSPTQAATATALGGVGGVAGQQIQARSAPMQAAIQAQMAGRSIRSKTADEGAKLGLKAPPADIEKVSEGGVSFGTKQLSSAAGADAMRFETQLQNQKAVNRAVKEELKIPKDAEVDINTLRGIRDTAGQVYSEIGAIGEKGKKALEDIEFLRGRYTRTSDPMERARLEDEFEAAFRSTKNRAEIEAMADVEKLRNLRAESRKQRDLYYSSEGKNADALQKSLDARDQAQALELSIEEAVTRAGKPDLAKKLRKARETIAKSYDAEDALNLGTGDFDARVLGRKLDQGKPLTGNLETIAKFQQAFKSSFGDITTKSAPGVSKLGLLGRLVTGGTVYGGTQSIPLALAGAVAPELAGEASRRYLLSGGRQAAALEKLRPKITRTPPLASVAARMTGQEAGETQAESAPITRPAVDFLIANPDTAKAFDEKYGKGLARKFLGANPKK